MLFLRKYNTLAVWLVWLASSFLDPSRGVPPRIRPNRQFSLIDLNRNHNDFDRLDFLGFPPPLAGIPAAPFLDVLWLAVAGCGCLWLPAGCGWLWLSVAGCGWLWLAVAGCCTCHSCDKLTMCVYAFALVTGMTSRLCIWMGCCTCHSCDKLIMCVCAVALVTGMTSPLCIYGWLLYLSLR